MINDRLRFAPGHLRETLFAITLGIAVCATVALPAVGQAPTARALSDELWTGHASCTVKTTYLNYEDTQTHTWALKNQPPLSPGAQIREFPATWTVTGSGSRKLAGGAGNKSQAPDTWAIAVRDEEAPLSVWELPGQNKLRIASRHGVHVAHGAVELSAHAPPGDVGEWEFPKQDFPLTQATVAGSSMPRTFTDSNRRPGWSQPKGATVTETCEWNFTRVGGQAQTSTRPGLGGPPASIAASAATNSAGRPLPKESVGRTNGGVVSPPNGSCQVLNDLVTQFEALKIQTATAYDQAIRQQENAFNAGGLNLTLAQQNAILDTIHALQATKQQTLLRLADEEAKVVAKINGACPGQSGQPQSNDQVMNALSKAADTLDQARRQIAILDGH